MLTHLTLDDVVMHAINSQALYIHVRMHAYATAARHCGLPRPCHACSLQAVMRQDACCWHGLNVAFGDMALASSSF